MKKLKTIQLVINLMLAGLLAPVAHGAITGITFTTLASFKNTNSPYSGANPYASPIFAADGNLYGALPYGGTNNTGVIYRVATNGTETTLHIFHDGDGDYPLARLAAGQDGKLYGAAASGGTNGVGTIFNISTNGEFSLLYSFGQMTNHLGYALDGANPYGGMTLGRDGNFYGTTYGGGTSNLGTVFKFATNGVFSVLHSFIGNGSNDEGGSPYTAPLLEVGDGVFYGTTSAGGTNNDGTVFRITAEGALTTLFEFNKTNGLNPYAGLCQGPDGILYGTTISGGKTNGGTIFQITTNGALTTLFQFTGTNGLFPEGGVAFGPGNVLYGVTYEGGVKGFGTLFQLTTNGHLSTAFTFTNGAHGANPFAGVVFDQAGALYGTTLYGGTNGGFGTVFRWTDVAPPTNSFTVPTSGQRWSNVVFAVNGKSSDNISVADVFLSVNGADWTEAKTTNNWGTWTGSASLIPGTNVLQSYSLDYSGNVSITNSVSFDFVVSNRLNLSLIGLGTIKPNYSNAWLEIGRNYSITSAPLSGFAFTNWFVSTNGLPGGSLVTGTNLHFMMASNLSLQANFFDVGRPSLTITAPTANQKMTNALATVRGTATDNWQVSNVWYQLNGGSWNLATSTNKYTNWFSIVLPLVAGTNSVNAYAQDFSGNLSITNKVNFVSSNTFNLQMSLAQGLPLTTTGLDLSLQISPGLNGHIQVSTNLINWNTFTNFIGSKTNQSFLDSAATNASQRFYRAVIP